LQRHCGRQLSLITPSCFSNRMAIRIPYQLTIYSRALTSRSERSRPRGIINQHHVRGLQASGSSRALTSCSKRPLTLISLARSSMT
jgi:hypothetical protein